MTSCAICCEKFNKVNHKKVNCAFCDFESCRSCVQKYCLTSTNDPHCMQCKNAWNREFMDAACTQTFCNKDLKNHREIIIFEREKCLMPATQPHVQRARQMMNISELLERERADLEARRNTIALLEANLRTLANAQANGILPDDGDGDGSEKKTAVVRRCPCDGCRGFLSSKWKCGVCEKKICSECNEEKKAAGEGLHECKPENVETVKLLKKDTKSCPKCGIMIFKISGCSQMWCPECHTAFNWNTLRIETGIIHNPHYYEFQRANAGTQPAGRNLGDIPCGGFPNYNELYTTIRHFEKEDYSRLCNIHRLVSHIQQYELRYVYRNIDLDVSNLDIRIKYLMNDMDEQAFKIIVQRREKAKNKMRDIGSILRMFSDTGADIMRQIVVDPDRENTRLDILNNLIRYTNTTFEHIHKRYKCVTPRINDRAELVTENYKKQ